MERYDIAIIGSGPAGVSAALTAKKRGKSVLLFGRKNISEKVEKSELICNYPGVGDITGKQLVADIKNQLKLHEIDITCEQISAIYQMGEYFSIDGANHEYQAKTVLLATGMDINLTVKGEEEFLGRGVSYCATCDGSLYRGKTIAVVCDSKELEEEVAYLAGLAKKVYYFPKIQETVKQAGNVEKLESIIERIEGDRKVKRMVLKDGTSYEIDGIFFLKKSVPPTALMKGIAMEDGHVVVDRKMSTNIPGVFAAGDCTGLPYQIAKAVGEGNVAVHAMISYLQDK